MRWRAALLVVVGVLLLSTTGLAFDRLISATYFGGTGDETLTSVTFTPSGQLIVGGHAPIPAPAMFSAVPSYNWTAPVYGTNIICNYTADENCTVFDTEQYVIPQNTTGFLAFLSKDADELYSVVYVDSVVQVLADVDTGSTGGIFVLQQNSVLRLSEDASALQWRSEELGSQAVRMALLETDAGTGVSDVVVVAGTDVMRVAGLDGAVSWKRSTGRTRVTGVAVDGRGGSALVYVSGSLDYTPFQSFGAWTSPSVSIYDPTGNPGGLVYGWTGTQAAAAGTRASVSALLVATAPPAAAAAARALTLAGVVDGSTGLPSVLDRAASDLAANSTAFANRCYPSPCGTLNPFGTYVQRVSLAATQTGFVSSATDASYFGSGAPLPREGIRRSAPCDCSNVERPAPATPRGALVMDNGTVVLYGATYERLPETPAAWYYNSAAVPSTAGFVTGFKGNLTGVEYSTMLPGTDGVADAARRRGRVAFVGTASGVGNVTAVTTLGGNFGNESSTTLYALPAFPVDSALQQAGFGGGASDGFIVIACVTSDADCESYRCPPGQFSAERSTNCTNCTAGTYSTTDAGKYRCLSCPAGSFSLDGAAACTKCPAGSFSNASASGACDACPAGTFSVEGSSGCTPCGPGRFSAGSAGQCDACPRGSFTNSSTASSCDLCPVGTYTLAAGSTNASACVACPAGTYGASEGLGTCTPCPVGFIGTAVGATSNATCVACGPGTHQPNLGATNCTDCPEGTYNDGTGAAACTACRAGTFLEARASRNVTDCQPCPKGTASLTAGAGSSALCLDCLPGTWSGGGQDVCSPCPVGTFSVTSRAISQAQCSSCGPMLESLPGAQSCSACPAGTYGFPGFPACLNCSNPIQTVARSVGGCDTPVDVVVVLDGYGGLSAAEFDLQKQFAVDFVRSLALGSSAANVAVLQYGFSARLIHGLSANASTLVAALEDPELAKIGGTRYLEFGIDLARSTLAQSARLTARRVMVLLAGSPVSNTFANGVNGATAAASTAKNDPNNIQIVGVGVNLAAASTSLATFTTVVSTPTSANLVRVTSFADLGPLNSSLAAAVCTRTEFGEGMSGFVRNAGMGVSDTDSATGAITSRYWSSPDIAPYALDRDAGLGDAASIRFDVPPGAGASTRTRAVQTPISIELQDPMPLVLHGWVQTRGVLQERASAFIGFQLGIEYQDGTVDAETRWQLPVAPADGPFNATSQIDAWTHFAATLTPPRAVATASLFLVMDGYSGSLSVDNVGLLPAGSQACACPAGQYYDLSLATCWPCTAGSFCQASARFACPAGTYSFGGATQCLVCPPGKVCLGSTLIACPGTLVAGSTSCLPCPTGSKCTGGVASPCPAGTYNSETGVCKLCVPGTYQNRTGQDGCDVCPRNWTSNYGRAACIPCAAVDRSEAGWHPCVSRPVVHIISPARGGVYGGYNVTIVGAALVLEGEGPAAVAAVALRGVPVAHVFEASPTRLLVQAGNATAAGVAPGHGDVAVTTSSAGTVRMAGGFQYASPGQLLAVQPASGPAAGGEAVTLLGKNLSLWNGDFSVTLCGVGAASVFREADGTLVAVTPAVAAGACDVTVLNEGYGSTSLSQAYTFV
eukprot:tig00020684_g12868.t1